jgi:hypothetical protein
VHPSAYWEAPHLRPREMMARYVLPSLGKEGAETVVGLGGRFGKLPPLA